MADRRPTPDTEAPRISVVVPLYNERESIPELYRRTRAACERLNRRYELIFVDDGSDDGSFEVLRELHDRDRRVTVVRFRKNYGQTAAMTAGFECARGEVVVSMDGDLQNDPDDIPRLLARIEEGFDVVCGWRKNRQDKLVSRRIPSVIANWIIGRVTGVRIHDNGCSLKAYRASVIKKTQLYSELHRFIPAMSTLTGARIAEIVVRHHPRRFGTSKYGLGRAWRVILDIITVKMITGFVSRPAVWFAGLGLPAAALGGLLLLPGTGVLGALGVEQRLTVATVSFLLLFLSAQFLSVGILGELAMKTGDYDPRRTAQPTIRILEVNRGLDETRRANGP